MRMAMVICSDGMAMAMTVVLGIGWGCAGKLVWMRTIEGHGQRICDSVCECVLCNRSKFSQQLDKCESVLKVC